LYTSQQRRSSAGQLICTRCGLPLTGLSVWFGGAQTHLYCGPVGTAPPMAQQKEESAAVKKEAPPVLTEERVREIIRQELRLMFPLVPAGRKEGGPQS